MYFDGDGVPRAIGHVDVRVEDDVIAGAQAAFGPVLQSSVFIDDELSKGQTFVFGLQEITFG